MIQIRIEFPEPAHKQKEEKDIMENYEMNSPSDKRVTRQHYQCFIKQLSDWYSSGTNPSLASEDTRFSLELQNQKLRSLGLDMQLQIEKQEGDSGDGAPVSYADNVFVNSICCNNQSITTSIRNAQKAIYSKTAHCMMTIVMQNPKQGGVPSPATAMCCPHCGAPSTLGRLESGCEFCNTKFLMDELYPKVMHFFIHDISDAEFDKKKHKKLMVRSTLVLMLLYATIIIIRLLTGAYENRSILEDLAGLVFGSIMLGAVIGSVIWFFSYTFGAVRLVSRNTRGAALVGKSLMFCHKMRELDPTFSTEYFRDKSMSLLKLILFSENPQELTVCRCSHPIPEKLREIVDIRHRNSMIKKYSIKDGVCNVSVVFYTDSLHFRDGKVCAKFDKIHLSMRKVITKPTDLGFTVKAVACPSCGASFDAEKVRNCPFCGNAYPIEQNEWVVTDIHI